MQETWVRSLCWKIPWRREWQPTPIFLPGEFYGQRSLVGCSPWGRKEPMTGHDWATNTHPVLFLTVFFFPVREFLCIHSVYHIQYYALSTQSDILEVLNKRMKSLCMLSCFSHVWLFGTLWTAACQALLSMGILQARILEWVAMPSSRRFSWPRNWTCISCGSCLAGGFFTPKPPGNSL